MVEVEAPFCHGDEDDDDNDGGGRVGGGDGDSVVVDAISPASSNFRRRSLSPEASPSSDDSMSLTAWRYALAPASSWSSLTALRSSIERKSGGSLPQCARTYCSVATSAATSSDSGLSQSASPSLVRGSLSRWQVFQWKKKYNRGQPTAERGSHIVN